jgi:hypothetical protein
LARLGKDYQVVVNKGIFPYLFVNKNNLNYQGLTPDIQYYPPNIDKNLYESTYKKEWNLREETLNYLSKDLLSLLEILDIFQTNLFLDHYLEMTEALTISSLAKNKFFKYYLKESKIPLINSNKLYNFIYAGYYGGITEVYRPYGRNLKYYDVNSLYPYNALKPMPGTEGYFIESFTEQGLDLDNLFGIFQAEVITNNLYHGLLPIKTKRGLLLPNGSYEGI